MPTRQHGIICQLLKTSTNENVYVGRKCDNFAMKQHDSISRWNDTKCERKKRGFLTFSSDD